MLIHFFSSSFNINHASGPILQTDKEEWNAPTGGIVPLWIRKVIRGDRRFWVDDLEEASPRNSADDEEGSGSGSGSGIDMDERKRGEVTLLPEAAGEPPHDLEKNNHHHHHHQV